MYYNLLPSKIIIRLPWDRPQVALFVPPKKDRVNPSQIMRDVTADGRASVDSDPQSAGLGAVRIRA